MKDRGIRRADRLATSVRGRGEEIRNRPPEKPFRDRPFAARWLDRRSSPVRDNPEYAEAALHPRNSKHEAPCRCSQPVPTTLGPERHSASITQGTPWAEWSPHSPG